MSTMREQGLSFSNLLHPIRLRETVNDWLKEDTPSFDYGGFVVGEKKEVAELLCKGEGVVAGVPFFEEVFKTLDCEVIWHVQEGDELKPSVAATVSGKVRNILLGERVALNCITRASGIATYGRKLKKLVGNQIIEATGEAWHGEIAGTRKTTPGFRMVEKYALLVGGLATHRYDLSSMIMLKDNHIWSAGSITQAVRDARSVGGFSSKVEVECRSLEEGLEAAAAGCDVVMLDNFQPRALHETASVISKHYPSTIIEASGGISDTNIIDYVGKDIDVISLSKTTQGYDAIDFSLKIVKRC